MNIPARTLSFLLAAALLAPAAASAERCLCENGHVAVDKRCAGECRSQDIDVQQQIRNTLLRVDCDRGEECLCIPISPEADSALVKSSTRLLFIKHLFRGIPDLNRLFERHTRLDQCTIFRTRTQPQRMAPLLLDLRTIVLRA